MQPLCIAIFVAGCLLVLIGWAWLLIRASDLHAIWAITCLLFPSLVLIQVVMMPAKNWMPTVVVVAGVSLLFFGKWLVGTYA